MAVLIMLSLVGTLGLWGVEVTEGTFVYALDDPYIHMALARNLVAHGVLGATPHEFTSASSSPLWTLLLAFGYWLAGAQTLLPLALGITAAIALLVVADQLLLDFGIASAGRFLVLMWIIVFTPLAAIVFSGMEHPAHALISLALVGGAAREVSKKEERWESSTLLLIVLAALGTTIRYEGLALLFTVVMLLSLRRRWRTAGVVALSGSLPLVIYGAYSVSQGGFFLPNPIIIKGSMSSGLALLDGGAGAAAGSAMAKLFADAYPLNLLLLGSVILLAHQFTHTRDGERWGRELIVPLIVAVATLAHVLFGSLGWFYRYEAYLYVLLGVSLAVQLHSIRTCRPECVTNARSWSLALLALLIVVASPDLMRRGWYGAKHVPSAMGNVYEQQYQMAHFLKENPQYRTVAIFDLGAIVYFNEEIEVFDMWGLGDRRPEAQILFSQGKITDDEILELALQRRAQIAIVNPDWFEWPDGWVQVGTWKISDNVVAAADEVAFVALPGTDAVALQDALRSYSEQQLPERVEVQLDELAP